MKQKLGLENRYRPAQKKFLVSRGSKLIPPFIKEDPINLLGCGTNHIPPNIIPLLRKLPPPKTKVNIWWRKHVTG